MQNNVPVAVLTHNPNGKWGDVRPIIEKQGYYEKWNKSINLELGQQILLYISNNVRQIQYLMEVVRVDDKTIDLKLIKKLTIEQMELLSYERLKEHGIKQGTINYSLLSDTQLNKYILNVLNNKTTDIQKDTSLNIKNIILYGSPGVGKTHNMNKLIHLIESGISEKEIFDSIKNNELNDGTDIDDIKDRIKFVTFHQSFGYEDFIEGFRPNEEGNIQLEKGIFLEICNNAQINFIRSIKYKSTLEHDEKQEKLFELFIDSVQDEIDKNGKFYINKTVYITDVEGDAFRYQGINWGNSQRMKFDDIKLLWNFHAFNRKAVKNVPGVSGLAKQHATYFTYLVVKFLEFSETQDVQIQSVRKEERKNYYLVIDEINRGNISKIFGELITLIEEDKRDTLEVTLPYSKQTFKIPSNLYIIGTMNSTDKSIALIDIALRRRFTFLKMEPNPDLVTHTKAQEIMLQLNQKITNTLGVDYVLGHSYFMKIQNDDDLEFVLEYKIKPLLEEYYYGDERLDEVLALCESKKND